MSDFVRDSHMMDPNLHEVLAIMATRSVRQVYMKLLAPNDNSKNQPYFGGSFEALNIFPVSGEFTLHTPESQKAGVASRGPGLKGALDFAWLDGYGREYQAPHAQLILYPQYPEVRFSGFLRSCAWAPRELMDPAKRGRQHGRILFLGVTDEGRILGYLAPPESAAAREAFALACEPDCGVFRSIDLVEVRRGVADSRELLLTELGRISRKGWISGKSLDVNGKIRPCRSSNCGGYTLEAELGVRPNGYSEPDFYGWEVKQHDVRDLDKPSARAVTLMTPNPDRGHFVELTLPDFIRTYGYPDRRGRPDRLNFGGLHRFGERQPLTGLSLHLRGFDIAKPNTFAADGALTLEDTDGRVAAGWSFVKLLDHWKRKHNRAVFVPSVGRKADDGSRTYRYGGRVGLGTGTGFPLLLQAVANGALYYDPGIKLEGASLAVPTTKSRSQFRIKSTDLARLYHNWEEVDTP